LQLAFIGGYNGGYLSHVELWRPATGTFAAISSMANTRGFIPSVTRLLPGRKVLVAGGYNGTNPAAGEILDLVQNGGTCAAAGDCESNICEDNVCCAGACSGTCKTCNGSGACVTVTGRQDPNTCTGTNICTAAGTCEPRSVSCTANPCDPTCQNFPTSTPFTPEAGVIAGSGWNQQALLSGVPPGFANKGADNPCDKPSECQFDFYCSNPGASGKCMQHAAGQVNANCNGVDLTLGLPCTNGTVPLCNRGNTAVAAGTVIGIYQKNGGGNNFGDPCVTNEYENCTVTLAAALAPGTCQNVDDCGSNGNSTLMVNPRRSSTLGRRITECASLGQGEAGCANNWTDVHKAGQCVATSIVQYNTVVYEQQYKANCPSGTKAQWMLLDYNSTIRSNASGTSSLKFEVASAPIVNTVTGTFTAYATVADTSAGDPAVCPFSGPAPCPKSVFTALGGLPNARNEALKVRVTLNPTPDKALAATLNSWQVTYSCPASE
jgi:hypothetical protein